jgi:membrane fusion protein (multidrug efflux system)
LLEKKMFRPGRGSVALLVPMMIFVLGACSGGDDSGPPAGNGHAEGGRPNHRPEQPPVPVAIAPAVTGSISSSYSANATLEANAEADVLARVPGIVQSLSVEEGDRVNKGEVLLQIEADEYRYRLQQAESSTKNLRSRYERLENMAERGLVSAEEFDAAEADFASAEANEGLARIELGYTTVRAPMDGFIVLRHVDQGQPISANVAVFRIANFEPLLARVHVPSKEFRRLTTEHPVSIHLDSDGTVLEGTIQLVSPVIDPTSGTIKVTVEITEYPANVRPGDFAEVRIVTERRDGRTLVPRVALVSDKGEDVVYVEVDAVAERRTVEIGISDDQNAEIISGVAVGEFVVVKGQRSLQHGQAVRVLEGDASDDDPVANEAAADTTEAHQGRKSS